MSLEALGPSLEKPVKVIPGWTSRSEVSAECVSGGITNRNFCIRVDGRPFFVRIAGEETGALGIDRDNERRAVEESAAIEVGPGVVAYLPEHGCLITEWVDGREVSPEELREREMLGRLVGSLKALHERCQGFPGGFSPFRVVQEYREFAGARGVEVPEVYWWLLKRAGEIEKVFRANPLSPRPCHNDLLNSNFLLEGGRMMIVDYEYAGMGDIFFDLGNLSVNNEFDEDTDLALLELYFGEATPARVARLKLMRLMSDFREAMWGVMQQVLSPLDFDYAEYAATHFARCRRQAEDARYESWLREAARPV